MIVRRAGRELSAPAAKPIVLLDGDELIVGPRHVRVHIHGTAPVVHPPNPLSVPRSAAAKMSAVAAAAFALSAVGCNKPEPASKPDAAIEVREAPPAVAPPPEPDRDEGKEAPPGSASAAPASTPEGASSAIPGKPKTSPIEVRNTPPDPWE